MALKLNKIPRGVLIDMRDKYGAPAAEQTEPIGECSKDFLLSRITKEEFFDQWCDYEGLINYGPKLRALWHLLKEAEIE
jgi:hypothetical protein